MARAICVPLYMDICYIACSCILRCATSTTSRIRIIPETKIIITKYMSKDNQIAKLTFILIRTNDDKLKCNEMK